MDYFIERPVTKDDETVIHKSACIIASKRHLTLGSFESFEMAFSHANSLGFLI